MLDLCKICTLQTIIFFGISVQLGWSILPITCNFMLRNCGTHTDCWQRCAINPDTKSTAMCLVEIFLLYKPNGRGQVSIGLVRKQFPIKKTTKALLRDCRSCKEKAVANGNMWMQNTQERAETPSVQPPVTPDVSVSGAGTSVPSVLKPALTRQSWRKCQMKVLRFSGSGSQQGRTIARCRSWSLPLCLAWQRCRCQPLSSYCSFRATRPKMLSPKAAAVGSWRHSDGHPWVPSDSEQLLPAPMPQGEGKSFDNFWFSAILCGSTVGLLEHVCSCDMREGPWVC